MPKKKENLGDIIDRNKAKLEADSSHKPAVYPKRIPEEEPVVTKPKKSSKKVSPWKDVVNPEGSPKELAATWKQGKPEEVAAKKAGLFASGKIEEVELSGARKLREAGQGANELEAKMKLQAEGPKININESKKAADLHTTLNTGEVKLSFAKPAAPPKPAATSTKPAAPPAPAPVTTKTVVAEPVAAKVEPVAVAKAAKAPALAGVEKLTKAAKPKANPVGKKIHNIFEELKTSVENRKDTPKAASSRSAIVGERQNLERSQEKPPTVKSVFKELKPGKGDPLAKFAVSAESENLKQASKSHTTPDMESPRAKLRMEMDEAGKAMKRFDPVKKYTPPVKLTRPPLELPKESEAEYRKGTEKLDAKLREKNPSWGMGDAAEKASHEARMIKIKAGTGATEGASEWLGVARKAAVAAEEGSKVSKMAKAGELAGKTAGKLGKLGIAGLAIYGGIEALKKIGSKLKE